MEINSYIEMAQNNQMM